jgi:lipopolysaccharide export system protein LptA
MSGNAIMQEGANVIRGQKIVVFLNENRGVVEAAENKRVTATIYPTDQKGKRK